jgi:outer membrane protein OmpA-like peptidoglycan-associated protein
MNMAFLKYTAKNAATLSGVIFLIGCANLHNYHFPSDADPQDELAKLQSDLDHDLANQVQISSPRSYKTAEKHFDKARDLRDRHQPAEKILKELAIAREFLSRAENTSDKIFPEIQEILTARRSSLDVDADRLHPNILKEIDDQLTEITKRSEKGSLSLSATEKSRLQSAYLDLEGLSIKSTRLSETKDLIMAAENLGAEKIVPNEFLAAMEKEGEAENVITLNRHDDAKIAKAVTAARSEAQKLLEATEGERSKINLPVELRSQPTPTLRFSEIKNQFNPADADVFQQDNKIVIRMKSSNFIPGKAELPVHSLSVLGLAKEVIKDLNAQSIVVEGHTDALGPPKINQKLSEDRATAVANYLNKDQDIPSQNVQIRGRGNNLPLSTNKTRWGREANRRVEIIITPAKSL